MAAAVPSKDVTINDNEDFNLLSLPEMYVKVSDHFSSLVLPIDESVGTGDASDEELSDIIDMIQALQIRINETGLFSKGEEIDEHPTSSLKYLFLDYFAAKFHGKWRNVDERAFHLLLSKKHYENFKKICVELKVLDEDEAKELRLEKEQDDDDDDDDDNVDNADSSSSSSKGKRSPGKKSSTSTLTPEQARIMKINKYKRDIACKKTIALLRHKLNNLKSKQFTDDGTEIEDDEADIRELYILQLQSYLRDTLDELSLLVQEIQMLQMMKSMKSNTVSNDGTNSSSSSSSSSTSGYSGTSNTGISIIKMNKTSDGQIIQTREQVKANVFQPRMSEPTMTLQEFGDLEYARAMERKAKEEQIARDGGIPGEVLDYKRLHQQGKEDDEELVDAATGKARGWDEWKECSSANWKGAGNKANKRY